MASAAFGAAYRDLRGIFESGTVLGLGDGQLLARYAGSGDESAFEALVIRHGPMVLATCRAVLKSEHDVEDAFQATFLVLARKAGSVKESGALGGWLHRVAYRSAVKASVEAKRRRRREAEASAMATIPRGDSRTPPDLELRPILHEEIDRLPEAQRLPVVLCDLEGLTYEQAAERLRWTVPTLRCRLAKARQRLKARLARRGVADPSLAAWLASGMAQGAAIPIPVAILSPGLVRAAVAAASGGTPSAGAALVAQSILRGMLMTKIKVASTATLAALALAGAGWIAAGAREPADDPAKPAMKPEAKSAQVPEAKPAAKQKGETVELRGRVVAPDGKPVVGASVALAFVYPEPETKSVPGTKSGPDGSFTLKAVRPEAEPDGYLSQYPWVVARAPGFAPGWAERALDRRRTGELVVKLAEDGAPIEGRVVDLEGRPVVGAKVDAGRLWFDEKGGLSAWLAKARNGAETNLWQGLQQVDLTQILPNLATTGPDGRFKVTGVGRERIAELRISGPGIATTDANVLARDEVEIRTKDRNMFNSPPFIVHSPKFQLAVMPSKRVEGTIRDRDTGKPVVGMELQAAPFDEHSLIPAPGVEAKTDAEGRYRLDGLPKADAYRLFLRTDKGLPYTNGAIKAPADSPGLEPVVFDFTLKRARFIRGRATDKVTGKPLQGFANYHALADNEYARDYREMREDVHGQQAYFDEEGRFEIVALPGRGLLAVRDEESRYRPATGFEKIKGYEPKYRGFNAIGGHIVSAVGYGVLVEVDIDPKVDVTTVDLQADPGRSVTIEVVGPDGQPLGDTKVKGMGAAFATGPVPQASTSFEVHALGPDERRRVIVMHERLKLIGSAFLKGDETGPVVVKLGPWGIVTGRIVDDEGHPRKGMFLNAPDGSTNKHPETDDILPWSDWNSGVKVGDDGRFLVEGLVPGLRYSAKSRAGYEAFGDLFRDVVVGPGETKDLGDLKVQPAKPMKED